MKVSKIIIEKILNDNNFSIELAKRLGNQLFGKLFYFTKNRDLLRKRFFVILIQKIQKPHQKRGNNKYKI